MAKKKSKKKPVNPHKLSQEELKKNVDRHLAAGRIGEAYSLSKVLLERFESAGTIELYQSILVRKISELESRGMKEEAARLVAEGKKRFSSSIFNEADEFVDLLKLDDDELIGYFLDKASIPELFRPKIADILYFNKEKSREFIRRHPEFKDLLYVSEAYRNGFHPVETPRLLAGVKQASPYSHWFLLSKAIQAFEQGDAASLEVVNRKMPDHTFPAFLTGRMKRCLNYLNGAGNDIESLSDEDLELFRILCGDQVAIAFMFSHLFKTKQLSTIPILIDRLKWFEKRDPARYPDIVLLCYRNELGKRLENPDQAKALFGLVDKITLPETVALNKTHFVIKVDGFDSYSEVKQKKIIDALVNSPEMNRLQLFKPNRLKAELLLYFARTLQLPGKSPDSMMEALFDRYENESGEDPVPLLEKALQLSGHNPEIFTLLINHYLDIKQKTSIVNKVVDRFLRSFPNNPEAYELAGKIAANNKSYKKAIGYFEKAQALTPLSRSINRTIVECFEGIVEKRTRQNVHLIDRDLKDAAGYLEESNPQESIQFCFLELKACLKKLELTVIDSSEVKLTVEKLLEKIAGDGPAQVRVVLLLLGRSQKNRNLAAIFDLAWKQIMSDLSGQTFLEFQHYMLSAEDYHSPILQDRFAEMTLHFLKRENEDKTLTEEQFYYLLLSALDNEWNKSFIGFVCLARSNFPENRVFRLLESLILSKPDHKKTQNLLCDPDLIDWFLTTQGKNLLVALAMYCDIFQELDYQIEDNRQIQHDEIIEMLDEMADVIREDINLFVPYLLEDCDSEDRLSLKSVRGLFGISIRVRGSEGLKQLPDIDFYDLDFYDDIKGRRKAERRREEQEKEEERERERRRKVRQEQEEKKRRINEEIEGKNDQLDIFNLIQDQEPES